MIRDTKTLFTLLLALQFISACATTPEGGGVYHLVKKGETLWRIARAYDCDPAQLAEANGLPDINIKAGSVLLIPNATHTIVITPDEPLPQEIYTTIEEGPSGPVQGKTLEGIEEKPQEPIQEKPREAPPVSADVADKKEAPTGTDKPDFIWPLNGRVSSKFGIYKGMRHNGIKIDGKEGASVLAAAGGTVIYSASIKYFGETIIIKHNDTYSTVYSHLKTRMASAGSAVKKGEQIGTLGKEEKTDKSHLNFEIRHRNRAKDPLRYLPKKK